MRTIDPYKLAAAALVVLVVAVKAHAADPSGTWKWKFTGQSGREMEFTLDLKADGEKLTGTLTTGQGRTRDISAGTFKNDEVSFETSVERNGNTITTKYKGKLEGDTIKGTSQRGRPDGGEGRTRDWEAKREKK
jgi:hypothetical protein